MIVAEILEFTRKSLKDEKSVPTRVVDEIVTSDYIDTGSADYTIYYTRYMPITSGSSGDVYFHGGRWDYEIKDTGDDGTRWIKFVSESGAFVLDSGAIQVSTGDVIKIGYTYDKPLSYTYRDCELRQWIKDAALWVNSATCGTADFTVTGSIYDDTLTIDPEPSDYVGQLISKKAQLEVRCAELTYKGRRGIYVKQGQIAIDTTKGGKDRSEDIRDLKKEIKEMVKNIIVRSAGGNRIDIYSTKDSNIYDQGYYQEANASEEDILSG